jgi:hypothetical protein
MSDLYSVLKQSILDRRLRSVAARQDVYAQARTAVIRQLWTYDPPLGEAEIGDRIGEFDHAVEMIEADVARIFAEARPSTPPRSGQRLPAARNVPILEGYDEAADYAPAVAGRPGQSPEKTREERLPARRQAARQAIPAPQPTVSEIEEALARRSAAIEDALRYRDDEPADRDDLQPEYRASEESHEAPYDAPARRRESEPEQDYYEPDRGDEEHASEPYEEEPYNDRRAAGETHYEDDGEAPARRWRTWRELSERHRILVLLAAIGALVLVLIVLAIALLFPPGASTPPDSTAATSADTPAIPGAGPADPSKVVETFVVFDGRDPTVFQTGPGNPIRFEGGTTGGYARVSSSAADAGVRVAIGPGLADRLAGHSIRLTVVARSAHENGAVGLRFAFQSGVALSPWQTANLQPDYVSQGLNWRVPKQRTDPDGDYILIEPGIPGDGTGADINSIRIDLLG